MSSEDELIATVVATSRSFREAQSRLGLSASTVFRRMRRPEVRERVDEQRMLMAEEVIGRLSAALTDAVDAIVEIMGDHQNEEGVRLRAAQAIIDNWTRLRAEVHAARELAALRQEIKDLGVEAGLRSEREREAQPWQD